MFLSKDHLQMDIINTYIRVYIYIYDMFSYVLIISF
jgi:hypothetical protein